LENLELLQDLERHIKGNFSKTGCLDPGIGDIPVEIR
jgi:hypothetical protein